MGDTSTEDLSFNFRYISNHTSSFITIEIEDNLNTTNTESYFIYFIKLFKAIEELRILKFLLLLLLTVILHGKQYTNLSYFCIVNIV